MKLAENLIHLRRKKGVTQEVIADFLGVTKASVSKWETGISLPDIIQLPRLASYYEISIDELMGYEAQLSVKEIKAHYEKFAEDFAKKPFDEVMEEVRDFIRLYYSCYPALVQMGILLLNHYMLAEKSKHLELLQEMVDLCEHIQQKSADANICINATILQAIIELQRGNPQISIQKLEPYYNVHTLKNGVEELLVQAYEMLGQKEEAMERNQLSMFDHLLHLLESSTWYLLSNLDNKEVGMITIERVQKVMETYEVSNLHPNSCLKFQYAMALFYATHSMDEEALEVLWKFVEDGVYFVNHALYLHGDAYFDRLDSYFEKMEHHLNIPRNKETILASMLQNLEHPIFVNMKEKHQFQQMKEMIESSLL